MIPGIRGSIIGSFVGNTPTNYTYINRYSNENNAQIHNYTISTGTASDDRIIVIGAVTTSDTTITCRLDDVPMDTYRTTFINNGNSMRWFTLPVSLGTTAAVRVTHGTTVARGLIAVWSLSNLMIPYPIDFIESSTSGTINVYSGGVLLAMYGHDEINGDTNVGSTWTGITERFDLEIENSLRISGGDHASVFGDVDRNISVSPSNPGTFSALSFR